MGNTAGKLSEKATRNPPGRPPGTTGKTPENLRNCRRENPFSRHAPPLRWQGLRPHFHMPAHLPFHFHPSASHHTPPKHPRHPAHGAWVRQPRANGTGRRHCRHPARRVGVRLHGAKAPRPQNAAGGKPLLVGLPPSTPTATPFGTKRRTPAPCSWGGRSSTSRQRHRPAALRPFVIFSSRHLPFPAHMNVVYS